MQPIPTNWKSPPSIDGVIWTRCKHITRRRGDTKVRFHVSTAIHSIFQTAAWETVYYRSSPAKQLLLFKRDRMLAMAARRWFKR